MAARAVGDPAIRAYLATKQPIAGGPGTADDCAEAALYLCEPASRFVTGTVLTVDGGWCVCEGQHRARDPGRRDERPASNRSDRRPVASTSRAVRAAIDAIEATQLAAIREAAGAVRPVDPRRAARPRLRHRPLADGRRGDVPPLRLYPDTKWNACPTVTASTEPSSSGIRSAVPARIVTPATRRSSSARISGTGSTATTVAPLVASRRVSLPVPAARSSTVRPGRRSKRSTIRAIAAAG